MDTLRKVARFLPNRSVLAKRFDMTTCQCQYRPWNLDKMTNRNRDREQPGEAKPGVCKFILYFMIYWCHSLATALSWTRIRCTFQLYQFNFLVRFEKIHDVWQSDKSICRVSSEVWQYLLRPILPHFWLIYLCVSWNSYCSTNAWKSTFHILLSARKCGVSMGQNAG